MSTRNWIIAGNIVLVLLTLLIVIVQFALQMEYVQNGWWAKWPYFWDENRYIDYAFYYADCIESGGLNGIVVAFNTRPPYAPTLLVTSLPAFLYMRNPISLFYSQILYVLLLDLGLFLITYRLSNSIAAGLVGVLIVHMGTTGIVCGSTLRTTAECVRYQLNFPVAALTVFSLAVLIECCYANRIELWSTLFSVSVTASFLVRAAAIPFFLAMLVPPTAWIGYLLWRNHRKRSALCVILSLLLAMFITSLYLVAVWRELFWYFAHAQTETRFQANTLSDWIAHYYTCGEKSSVIFPYCFSVAIGGGTITGMRTYLLYWNSNLKGWVRYRPLIVICVVMYAWVMTYLLPTASPAKNQRLADAFLFLTLAQTVSWIHVYTPRVCLRLFTSASAVWCHRFLTLLYVTIILDCGIIVVDQWLSFHAKSQLVEVPHREGKLLRRMVYRACSRFIEKWSEQNNRESITIGFVGQRRLRYENHTFRMLPFLEPSKRVHIRASGWWKHPTALTDIDLNLDDRSELLFVPQASETHSQEEEARSFNFHSIRMESRKKLVQMLEKKRYRFAETIKITPSFSLDVYHSESNRNHGAEASFL